MSSTVTVRDIEPGDKSWLKCEARRCGVSMEELVRRLIHEHRENAEGRTKPSEAFKLYFGSEHGVDLPPPERHGYRPVAFPDEGQT